MEKFIFMGVEIQFNSFIPEVQRQLYKKNKEELKEDAAKSNYVVIRKEIAIQEQSSEFLNRMIRDEIKRVKSINCVIEEIFKNPQFQIEEDTIETMAKSENWNYRKLAAEKSISSEFLNRMLIDEIASEEDEDVINEILQNPLFKGENEILEILSKAVNWEYRKIAAEKSTSSELLNKILREEIKEDEDPEVIKAVLTNKIFQIERETKEILEKFLSESQWIIDDQKLKFLIKNTLKHFKKKKS